MSEWREVRLGEVAGLDVKAVAVVESDVYPIVGVLNRGRGLLRRDPIRGSDTSYKTLNLIRPQQIVYSRLKAFEGAITVVPRGSGDAYASAEFPTFTCGPNLVPGYFALLTTTPSLWDTLQNLSIGMGGRRERVNPRHFLNITMALPPLPEQRRIVAVLSAVDAHIEALEAEVKRLATVHSKLVTEALADVECARPFGEVATVGSGPSWAVADESPTPGDGLTPVVKITNTRSDGTVDLADLVYVRGLPATTALIDDSSLIVIRTNGNKQRIGNVYLPPTQSHGCAVSAFQFLVKTFNQSDRDYLYWVLREAGMQAKMSDSASGSTGLGNMAAKWLRTAELAWPRSESERHALAGRFDAGRASLEGLSRELAALRKVRSDLLSALLSQAVTVDEVVDQFVDRGA